MSILKQWSKKFMKSNPTRSNSSESVIVTMKTEMSQGFEAEDENLQPVWEEEPDSEIQKQILLKAIMQQKIIVKSVPESDFLIPSSGGQNCDKDQGKAVAQLDQLESFTCSCPSCSHHRHGGACKCRNCRTLMNLTECGVCYDSLQSQEVRSCPVCSNVVCENCSNHLVHCAFCRSEAPAERNRALERLIDRLLLPCKNSRSGCTILLDAERRFAHESSCRYSTMKCPMGSRSCRWNGLGCNVASHLRNHHLVKPIEGKDIYIEIYHFRNKASSLDARIYPIYMVHRNMVFMIRVKLHHSCLRLQFLRMSAREKTKGEPIVYGMKIGVKALEGRKMLDVVALDNKTKIHEFTVACEYLYPNKFQADEKVLGDDLVRIYVGLEKLESV